MDRSGVGSPIIWTRGPARDADLDAIVRVLIIWSCGICELRLVGRMLQRVGHLGL